ncbi:helix-turn-helix transcriptional regulator [Nocardia sp. NPDC051321]|uniref:helix-turn-helix transcriptional regulator n=1 Tax=Nocardia sp. NPDC051321 TaxID=3364323 RepID=UPI00379CA6F0
MKLRQVLPSRLRSRVATLTSATVHVPGVGRPTVDAAVRTAVAGAIGTGERLRFDYETRSGTTSRRDIEPHRLVYWRGHWYLAGWDPERGDWRAFRVDRIVPKTPNGPRFTPRMVPEAEIAERVQRGVGTATWRFRATVRMAASESEIRAKIPAALSVEPDGPDHCVVQVGSDTSQMLTCYRGLADVEFEVLDAPELAEQLLATAERFRWAAGHQ